MADNIHVVVWGDTLSQIALDNKTTVDALVKLNNIKDPDFIVVGQKIKLSGTPTKPKVQKLYAEIDVFGLLSAGYDDRTMYAKWHFSKGNREHYEICWWYKAKGSSYAVKGSETTTEDNHATWTAPENATQVKFYVKPIAKTREVNGKDTPYWTADSTNTDWYKFSENPPSVAPTPSVTITGYKLTAELNNISINADYIQFQIVKDDKKNVTPDKGTVNIKTTAASYSCTVAAGGRYKVRCRGGKEGVYGPWSDYSNNINTPPAAPGGFMVWNATSETSVYLEWSPVNNATSYDIEYTTKESYFDGSDQTTTQSGITGEKYEKTGLTTGETYFFRLRATNDKGSSPWSAITSIILGTAPAAPTTWSSTTTAVQDEKVMLYWMHNSEDGSKQTSAQLEIEANGTVETYELDGTTSSYELSTSGYIEGAKIQWRVRTKGVLPSHGEWSSRRTIDIYAPPTLELSVTDLNRNDIETLTSFPFKISAIPYPLSQSPIGYHLSIVSEETEAYETVDDIGNVRIVNPGDTVYSKTFDISTSLDKEISAQDVTLDNGKSYSVVCMVTMNSGLTAEASSSVFTVGWDTVEYFPNAEYNIDPDAYTIQIRPFCEDAEDNRPENVTLSVYRREFDGSFTEIATDLSNVTTPWVVDPHPALNYARYRIVAKDLTTGQVIHYDPPGYPTGGKSVIIQWDEEYRNFETDLADELAQPPYSGSLLKLPYNIDVSDKSDPDASLVKYIGRENPVAYYGTHIGSTSTWNVTIDKHDEETLYGLRRLMRWMGNVYVREPSGSGYWARIVVSFSQKHKDPIVPVTLDITRVEGGK